MIKENVHHKEEENDNTREHGDKIHPNEWIRR